MSDFKQSTMPAMDAPPCPPGTEHNSPQTKLSVPQSKQQHLAPHVGTY